MSGYFVTAPDPFWVLSGHTLSMADATDWLLLDCSGILFDCPIIQSPGNPSWDLGTGGITNGGAERVPSVLIDDTDSPYDIPATCRILRIASTGGPVQVNLPAVATSEGRRLTIVDWDGAANVNNDTIAAQPAETVNGAASVAIVTSYGGAELYCEDGAWRTLQATV